MDLIQTLNQQYTQNEPDNFKIIPKYSGLFKGFNFTGFLDKMISLILGLNTSLLTHMDRTNIILYYSTLFFRQTTAVIGKKDPRTKMAFFNREN